MNASRLFSILIVILLVSTLFAGFVNDPTTAQASGSVSTNNMKYIAFRDDDIAPYSDLNTLKAVNQVHIDENVPVSLAVIPHPDTSDNRNELLLDTPLRDYLQATATNPLFELAQHGYNHHTGGVGSSLVGGAFYPRSVVGAGEPSVYWKPEGDRLVGAQLVGDSEFQGRTYDDQYNAIKWGWDDMNEALGITPTTFIPPFNVGDANTVKAAQAVGHTLYSTGPGDVSGVNVSGIIVQDASLAFPWTEPTDWNTAIPSLISDTDRVIDAAPGGANIVVFYHFWAFEKSDGSINTTRLALLNQYIDHLKGRGDVYFRTLGGQPIMIPSPTPAVCSQDGNSLDVFAQGAYHALWHKQWQNTTGWSSWEFLGGYLTSSPAAVSRGAGKIDVFVRGTDGALWSRYTTDGGISWASWYKIGGQLLAGTGPTAYAWGSNQIGWLVTGTNHALYHMWNDGTMHGWENLGGYLTSSPAATSPTTGDIDVFGRGGDGAVWWKTYYTGWKSWTSLGGQLTSGTGPAACSWGSGRLDVFVQGTDGALWQKAYNNGWAGWGSLGGKLTSSPAAATASGSSRIDAFVRGTDNGLWEKTYIGGWNTWTSIGNM
jgi:Uncharacterized protein conserved in bacteria (DUF2334)